MIGINKNNGKALSGLAHLRQSITDILTTPKGSRVMRREYGSRLFELIDAPLNSTTVIQLYAATAQALDEWEPRFKLHSTSVNSIVEGKVTLDLVGEYINEGKTITLEGIMI